MNSLHPRLEALGPAVCLPTVGMRLPLRLSPAAGSAEVALTLYWQLDAESAPRRVDRITALASQEADGLVFEALVPRGDLPGGRYRLSVTADMPDGAATTDLVAEVWDFAAPSTVARLSPAILRSVALRDLPRAGEHAAWPGDTRLVMREAEPRAGTSLDPRDLRQMAEAGALAKRVVRGYQVPELSAALLEEAVVFGPQNVVASRLGVLEDSWRGAKTMRPEELALGPFRTPRAPKHLDGTPVLTQRTAYLARKANYYHFHAEHIAALLQVELLRKAHPGLDLFALVPDYAPMHAESVALLGADLGPAVTLDGSDFSAARLVFPSAVLGNAERANDPLMAEALQRIRRNALAGGTAHGARAVYVSRLDATSRRMRNEDRLVEALASRGVGIFTAGGRSYREQVLCFADARVVIGPHGAGLTNIGFAAPGATLVEIFQASFTLPFYPRLAALLGCPYRCFTQRDGDEAGDPGSWTLDLDAFLAFLDPILARTA
ncbi:glycosyltransferase family 61 protein [Falsiroseomonas oryziterrae]|uniref:glycosyltransferase family 61 protein n=1 Tax=Falsiroseomonas oryziterrae TaxID=2911368 RepID=UPI001F290A57|nr:glycosyltransferase family 61 protein [Roseomonas sp. NPKOSM-4]